MTVRHSFLLISASHTGSTKLLSNYEHMTFKIRQEKCVAQRTFARICWSCDTKSRTHLVDETRGFGNSRYCWGQYQPTLQWGILHKCIKATTIMKYIKLIHAFFKQIMANISLFDIQCEDLLLFLFIYDRKLRVFGFWIVGWTKEAIWRHYFGLFIE